MEGWAQPAPPGFHGAAAAMGKLEPKVLTSLVKSCVLGGSQADPSAYALGAHELQGVVNALTFVFRTATKGEVSQENFQAWLAGEGVDSERATALAAVFEQKRAATTATYRKGLTVPELSQFDWKLGVSMASSDWCVTNLPPQRRPARSRFSMYAAIRVHVEVTRGVPQRLAVDWLRNHPAACQRGRRQQYTAHVRALAHRYARPLPSAASAASMFGSIGNLVLRAEFEDFAKSWAQIGQLMEAQTAED